MRVAVLLPLLSLLGAGIAAQEPAVGVPPVAISVAAPVEEQHNPHSALGAPFHSWIVVPASVWIDPNGRVTDVELRRVFIAGLSPQTGAFTPTSNTLVPRDAARFEEAARTALQRARFEKDEQGSGGPRRSFVNLAWKANGGSVDLGAVTAGGSLRHGPAILARTFDKGTTFYLWRGVCVEVKAKRLELVDDADRREALGLPSPSFAESLPAACEVLERQPSGVFSQNLDEPLRPGEELNFEYPEAERRARAEGVVLLLVRVTADGSVSGAYTSQPTPGHPAFAESVIRTACRLRFNKPRRADAPVTALFPQYAEFKLD